MPRGRRKGPPCARCGFWTKRMYERKGMRGEIPRPRNWVPCMKHRPGRRRRAYPHVRAGRAKLQRPPPPPPPVFPLKRLNKMASPERAHEPVSVVPRGRGDHQYAKGAKGGPTHFKVVHGTCPTVPRRPGVREGRLPRPPLSAGRLLIVCVSVGVCARSGRAPTGGSGGGWRGSAGPRRSDGG